MITIRYCAEGEAVSDFGVEEWWAKALAYNGNVLLRVSTTLPITRARVAVCEADLFCVDVAFEFQGELLHPDPDGRLAHWPRGFCDAEEDLLFRLLDGGNR